MTAWSLLRWISSDQRLCLAAEKARMLLYTAVTKRLERRQRDTSDTDILMKSLLEE